MRILVLQWRSSNIPGAISKFSQFGPSSQVLKFLANTVSYLFVVYELFTKSCKTCSLETWSISVPSFQFLVQGEESPDQKGDGQETQNVFLFSY